MGASGEITEPTELLELEVAEVSLVDKAAIRRKFAVVKAIDADADTDTTEDGMGARAKKTEKSDNAPGDVVDAEVVKAATPMLTALAGERLALVGEKANELKNGLGAMSKKDAREALYALTDLVWAAERDVVAVSKSIGVEPKEKVETEKAHPKKMTSRRRAALAEAVEKLQALAKEFDEETEDPEEEDMGTPANKETKKTEGGEGTTPEPAASTTDTVVAAVQKAVGDALKPLDERLSALEKKVEKAAEPAAAEEKKEKVEKAEGEDKSEPVWARELRKSLEGVGKRLDTLEAGSNSTAGNRTDTTTQETKKAESVFSGIL